MKTPRKHMEKICPVCSSKFYAKCGAKEMCSIECRLRNIATQFSGDGCWEWPLSSNPVTGYGQISCWENGKQRLLTAHRLSHLVFVGDVPSGFSVLHHCDNRKCFNPKHLYTGTQKQNVRDMWDRGRAVVVTPAVHWTKKSPEKIKRGADHFLIKNGSDCLARGSSHYASKITEDDVAEIRKSSETLLVLSKKYGVSQSALSAIKNRKKWVHVK